MAVVPSFSAKLIERHVAATIENHINTIIQTMQFAGERFVVNVRTKIQADEGYREAMRAIEKVNGTMKVPITEATPRFGNRTHALQSSVGFIITNQGKQVVNFFDGDNSDGVSAGKESASEIAKMHPSGLVLIGVAGMNYAAAVESLGYDVITGSSFILERDLKEALQGIVS